MIRFASLVIVVALAAAPAQATVPAAKPWYVWDYHRASVCLLGSFDRDANTLITAAVADKTLTSLQPMVDRCAAQPGLANRSYETQLFINILVWTAYLHAGQCAYAQLPERTVPASIEDAMRSCNPALSNWYESEQSVRLQTLRSVRHARNWHDQLNVWKADPKLRSSEGQLALCLVELNPDGAFALASAVTAGRNWAEANAIGRAILPDIAKPCAGMFRPKLKVKEVMKYVADFLWVSRGSSRNWNS